MPVLNAHCRKIGWQDAAPLMITGSGSTIGETITGSNFSLAKGRTVEKYADTISSGVQPTRKALPQLIPDGLPEHLHLEAALMVQHPMTYVPSTTAPVRYALKHATDDVKDTARRRITTLSLVDELAEACKEENERLTGLCEGPVQAVLVLWHEERGAYARTCVCVRHKGYHVTLRTTGRPTDVGLGTWCRRANAARAATSGPPK